MIDELIAHHEENVSFRKDLKLKYDAAEHGDWSIERRQREFNEDMLRFHQRAVEFLKNVKE